MHSKSLLQFHIWSEEIRLVPWKLIAKLFAALCDGNVQREVEIGIFPCENSDFMEDINWKNIVETMWKKFLLFFMENPGIFYKNFSKKKIAKKPAV